MKKNPPSAIPSETSIVLSKDLGKLIRHARKVAKLPIDQAAMLCGVSKQFLSDLEHGKPSIQFDKAVSVALQLGIEFVARPRGLSALNGGNGNEP